MSLSAYSYTCEGCGLDLEPGPLFETDHVCAGWWDDHGIFDALPLIRVDVRK